MRRDASIATSSIGSWHEPSNTDLQTARVYTGGTDGRTTRACGVHRIGVGGRLGERAIPQVELPRARARRWRVSPWCRCHSDGQADTASKGYGFRLGDLDRRLECGARADRSRKSPAQTEKW